MRNSFIQLLSIISFLFSTTIFAQMNSGSFVTTLGGLGSFISGNPGFANPVPYTTYNLGSAGWDQPHHPSCQQYNANGTMVLTYNGTAYSTNNGALMGSFNNAGSVHVNQWSNVNPNVVYSTTSTNCTQKTLNGATTIIFDLASAQSYFGLNFSSFWGGSLEGSFIVGADQAIAVFGILGSQVYCLVWKIGVGWLPEKYLMPLSWDNWDLYCTTPIGNPKISGNLGYVYCKDVNQTSSNTTYPWRIISITNTGASSMQNGNLNWTNHASMCVWQDTDGTFMPGLIDIYGNLIEPNGSNFSINSNWTGAMHVGWIRGTIYALGENGANGANAMVLRKSNFGGYQVLADGSSSGNTSYAGCYAKDGTTNINFLNSSSSIVQMRKIAYQDPDAQAPSAPTNLLASAITQSSFMVNWTASTDNTGVTGYDVFLNGAFVNTSTTTSFNFTLLNAATSYVVTVKAKDAAGNISVASSPLNVTTNAVIACTLPPAWNGVDIGTINQSSCENNGTYTIIAAGADIWNTADQFRYTYKVLNGDGVITAKINSIQNTDPWAKSGVMIRENLTPGAKHVDCYVTSANGISFQLRSATDGNTSSTIVSGISAPYWVRLERIGNIFNAYCSIDGVNWQQVGSSTTVSMSANVYIGLAATSHAVGVNNTSYIDNVSTVSTGSTVLGHICADGSTFFTSNVIGTNYQWQLNMGTGFVNIVDNANYVGTNAKTLVLNNLPSAWYNYQYRCVTNTATSQVFTLKFISNWTGSFSSAWEEPLNWSCNKLPDGNTDVMIKEGSIVLVNSNVLSRSLTIKNTASLTVKTGFSLSIRR